MKYIFDLLLAGDSRIAELLALAAIKWRELTGVISNVPEAIEFVRLERLETWFHEECVDRFDDPDAALAASKQLMGWTAIATFYDAFQGWTNWDRESALFVLECIENSNVSIETKVIADQTAREYDLIPDDEQ